MTPLATPVETAHLLIQYEEAHGIPHGTLARYGWVECVRDGRPALRYPVGDTHRWRFMDGAKPKYDQPVGYHPVWYGLSRAAASARKWGLDYLVDCNGAASTIAADCRHIPAFSLASGESTSPTPELLAELQSQWTGRVYVAFDCDAEGRRGAVKRVQAYRKHGIVADALDLALTQDGGDLADYLMQRSDNADLLTCARLSIPVERTRKLYVPQTQDEADRIEMARLALAAIDPSRREAYDTWTEIGMTLEELGPVGLEMWDRWSAGSAKYKDGACARKWRSFKNRKKTLNTLYWLADLDSGKSWRPYKPPTIGHDMPCPAKDEYPDSIPVAVRGALNTYAYPAIAPVLELWIEGMTQGYILPGEPQTFECLKYVSKKTGRRVSDQTIRSGLKYATDPHGGQFLVVFPHISINQEEDTGILELNPCARTGRSPVLYELRPWSAILANLARLAVAPILRAVFPADDPLVAPICADFLFALGRDDAATLAQQLHAKYATVLASQPGYREALNRARKEYRRLVGALSKPSLAPIPAHLTYRNSTEYAARCIRAIVEEAGGETQMSIKELTTAIGCSSRSLASVLRKASIKTEKDQTIDVPIRSALQLRSIGGYSFEARGAPVAVVSSARQAPFPFAGKGMFTWAAGELAAGARLSVRYHQANRQSLLRLPYASLAWLRGLFVVILAALEPDAEPEKKEKSEPLAVELPSLTVWQRYAKQVRIRWLLAWYVDHGPKPKETYEQTWLRKVVTLGTPWQADPDRLTDRAAGEIQPYSVQLAFSVLLEPTAASPPLTKPAELMAEIMADPLIDWIVHELGGTVSEVNECILAA